MDWTERFVGPSTVEVLVRRVAWYLKYALAAGKRCWDMDADVAPAHEYIVIDRSVLQSVNKTS